jgi:hypothetical protein
MMGNRDWNRIEAELEAGLPGNHQHYRPKADNRSCKDHKLSKTGGASILKHIEEALQEDDDGV